MRPSVIAPKEVVVLGEESNTMQHSFSPAFRGNLNALGHGEKFFPSCVCGVSCAAVQAKTPLRIIFPSWLGFRRGAANTKIRSAAGSLD